MLPFPIQIDPEEAVRELVDMNQKVVKGLDVLSNISEDDIVVGCSEKEAVYQEDKMVLYHYKPLVEKPFKIPVLIVYALVNRPYMVDLQENRSLVRNLLNLGLDVYIIDWGYPTRSDRWITLDDYINSYIDNSVDYIREAHGLDKINILGVCQGGTFSLCYSSINPDKVNALITSVTPVDYEVEKGLLNMWAGACAVDGKTAEELYDVDAMVDAMGNIPGDFMNFGFLMMIPFTLSLQKYIDMVDVMESEEKLVNFLRMEKWIFDSPDQAGEAYRQFMKDFYQGNKMAKGGLVIGDKEVDLKNLTMPILNVYADYDHLVPPASSKALKALVGSEDYTEQNYPVGHIGMYVSGKVQKTLPNAINDWLRERA